MTTYGLNDIGGFIPKPPDVIAAEIAADERTLIDPSLALAPDDPLTKVNAIMVQRFDELWKLGVTLYEARDPATATKAALDTIAAITGTVRGDSTKGIVTLTVTLAPHFTLGVGAVASVAGEPTNTWVTVAPAFNGTASPQAVAVLADATVAGAITADAGTITVIANPQNGWLAVTNTHDAIPGNDADDDETLRQRREVGLQADAGGDLGAIRSALLKLRTAAGNPVVTVVDVFENESGYPDSLGRPPNSIEVLISQWGAGHADPDAPALFGAALWRAKPGGMELVGANALETPDGNGTLRAVRWNESDKVQIYVGATLVVDLATYPGDQAASDALKAYGLMTYPEAGATISQSRLLGFLVTQVPGVLDCNTFGSGLLSAARFPLLGARGGPPIYLSARQSPVWDTGNFTITSGA